MSAEACRLKSVATENVGSWHISSIGQLGMTGLARKRTCDLTSMEAAMRERSAHSGQITTCPLLGYPS